ncbi:MAG: SCP2 sterol-binding domain-containing protein [bacterium]
MSDVQIPEIPPDATPKWMFEERLPKRLDAALERFKDQLEGVEGVLQFNIEGDNGGQWCITLKEGKGEVTAGENEDASTTFTISAEDWMALIRREVDPQTIFMSGRMRIAGDMGLAMKLGQIIRGAMAQEG